MDESLLARLPRNVKVRAYFHGADTAGSAEVARIRAPFPRLCAGDRFDGIEAVYRPSDQNYVRLDMPTMYATPEDADAAASAFLDALEAAGRRP